MLKTEKYYLQYRELEATLTIAHEQFLCALAKGAAAGDLERKRDLDKYMRAYLRAAEDLFVFAKRDGASDGLQ